jgi:pimeloyl-ACP methyl ester carboxylesterase
MAPITRHFVTIKGGRQVHYRRAGRGAPVVLLHASPSSSLALTPFIAAFGDRFAAIALDTPGFGLSDPLTIRAPQMRDYARAVAEALDALGVRRCAIFGSHTGASIASEFTIRYPNRVAVALFDGYPAYKTQDRRDNLAHYIPPFQPIWNGTHLIDFWQRYREMSVFWPWYKRDKAHRATSGGWGLERTHQIVMAGLLAGRGYHKGYAAVFRYPGTTAMRALKRPACFAGREEDSLILGLKELGELPAGSWTEVLPRDDVAAARRYIAILNEHMAKLAPAPRPRPAAARTAGVTRDYVRAGGHEILLRRAGTGGGVPLVMVPGAPSASDLLDPVIEALGATRPVIAFDPPGVGDSDRDGVPSVDGLAAATLALADGLKIATFDLYGLNGGAAIAVATAISAPDRIRTLVLDGAPALDDATRRALAPAYARPIELDANGGHLIDLWEALRYEQLYWPWYNRSLAAIRPIEPQMDFDRLTLRTVGILKQYRNFAPMTRALLSYPLMDRLPQVRAPIVVGAQPSDPFARFVADAAKPVTGTKSVTFPEDPAAKAAAIARQLG